MTRLYYSPVPLRINHPRKHNIKKYLAIIQWVMKRYGRSPERIISRNDPTPYQVIEQTAWLAYMHDL